MRLEYSLLVGNVPCHPPLDNMRIRAMIEIILIVENLFVKHNIPLVTIFFLEEGLLDLYPFWMLEY